MPASLMELRGVTLSYHDGSRETHAVHQVNLDLPSTGFIGIMGPSGSGKSSLLYLMSGLKLPSSGSITHKGSRIDALPHQSRACLRRERFGFIFQQPFLLNYLTALENVLTCAPAQSTQAVNAARKLLNRLGIEPLAGKRPHELSGGERQRVCVARAMMNRPSVLFADEPTASLDHVNGHAVVDLLSSYRTEGLVIMVTHDEEMLAGADWIIRMRDGALEESR